MKKQEISLLEELKKKKQKRDDMKYIFVSKSTAMSHLYFQKKLPMSYITFQDKKSDFSKIPPFSREMHSQMHRASVSEASPATPQTVAHQAPLSMHFSKQE